MASEERSKGAGVVRPIHPAQSDDLGRDRAHGQNGSRWRTWRWSRRRPGAESDTPDPSWRRAAGPDHGRPWGKIGLANKAATSGPPQPAAPFSPDLTVARRSFFCPNRNKRFDNISSDRAITKQGRAAQMSPDRSGVYYPEELSLLGHVLNQAVESLPTVMRTPGNRAEIARNILACAATGERDPIELERAALTNLKMTAAT
jgi:hypothetical protein